VSRMFIPCLIRPAFSNQCPGGPATGAQDTPFSHVRHLHSLSSSRLFGTQVTPPAPILKVLPKIFGHSDKTVRSEGSNLAHALYQYLGPGIEPWLAELKPVQVKELKEAWESMEKEGRGKGTLKPERMTRQQARDAEQNTAGGEDVGGDAGVEEGASTLEVISNNCER